jgi:ergothioneine biosynthesis protein EgtB
VLDYAREVDQLMLSALSDGEPHEVFPTCIEHEEMHQETLVYMLHQLPLDLLNVPEGNEHPAPDNGSAAHRVSPNRWRSIPAGMAELGARPQDGFGWDNEFPRTPVFVGDFEIQEHKITNGEFLAFVEAGGYEQSVYWSRAAWKILAKEKWRHPQLWRKQGDRWLYRALFAEIELPLAWPVLVSHDEACAYANWKSLRLPTEAEYARAASFVAEPRIEPASAPSSEGILARELPILGNYNFKSWDLQPCDAGAPNAAGVRQLVGNGWEWTSTPFFGLPGFKPMPHYPGYSADFFDGLHYILKGASPVTARGLVRPSFRNWFRHHYRYAYTTFRCVRESDSAARKS